MCVRMYESMCVCVYVCMCERDIVFMCVTEKRVPSRPRQQQRRPCSHRCINKDVYPPPIRTEWSIIS